MTVIPTFVKWAGGKTQLIKQYIPLFPKKNHIKRYFEPMVGSGAVFFYIKQVYNPDYSMIFDINNDLINLYLQIRDNVDEMINFLKIYKSNHTKNPKEYYYKMREKYNNTEDKLERSTLLLYLNKTCYNGLYRVNSKGEFNVPFGRYKNPAILQEEKLRLASNLLEGTIIKALHFEKILDYAKPNDFIYFDPPYYPLSETSSFTNYQKGTFLDKEQKKLASVFKELDKKNCKVMLSNSDTDLIRDLYKGYNIKVVRAKRMISCKGKGRGAINELVIRNYAD